MKFIIPWLSIGFALITAITSIDVLFVSMNTMIRYYDLNDPDNSGTTIHLDNASAIVDIDYDPQDAYIYYTDRNNRTISRVRINGTDEELIISDVNPTGLTLDVEFRMMYWTNSDSDTIERSWLNGTRREVLIRKDLYEPSSIVLDKDKGKMIWKDMTRFGAILRVDLNGQNIEYVVRKPGYSEFVLGYDPLKQQLYWSSDDLNYIVAADMDGKNEQHYVLPFKYPIAVATYGDYLYWEDGRYYYEGRIMRSKKSQNDQVEILRTTLCGNNKITAIYVNNRTHFIFYADYYYSHMIEVDVDVGKVWNKVINTLKGERLTSFVYDPIEDRIYWIDINNRTIERAYRNGTDKQVIANSVDSYWYYNYPNLAISWQTDELFFINDGDIEKMTLSGDNRTTIITFSVHYQKSIAVDQIRRYIYWTSRQYNGTIERANYAGQERTVILYGLHYPRHIILDVSGGIMYWLEQSDKVIKVATLNGTTLNEIRISKYISDFTLLGEFIYWISSSEFGRINKYSENDTTILANCERYQSLKIIQGLLFVWTTTMIRYYDLLVSNDPGTDILLKNQSNVVAIDYDPLEGYVYWADNNLNSISRARINGTDQEVIFRDLDSVSSLTLDVKTRMIYWVADNSKGIERSYLNATGREFLVKICTNQPKDLVLDQDNGNLYWTDMYSSIIEKAYLNGTDRGIIRISQNDDATAFTFDPSSHRIYWLDSNRQTICSTDLDSRNFEDVATNSSYINQMTAYGHYIYYIDDKNDVWRINTRIPGSDEVIIWNFGYNFYYYYYHGYQNQHTIRRLKVNDSMDMLLFGNGGRGFIEVDLSRVEDCCRPIELLKEEYPISLDYDPRDDRIYWIDYHTDSIKHAFRNGTDIKVIVTGINTYYGDLAVSWETRDLFWSHDSNINKMTLSGGNTTTIISNLASRISVALHMRERYVYWISYSNNGTIERATYTGEDQTLILHGLYYPRHIVLDVASNLMYWTGAYSSDIKVATLNGTLVDEISLSDEVITFTVLDDSIYSVQIKYYEYQLLTKTTNNKTNVLVRYERFNNLRIKQVIHECETNTCLNNGTCVNNTIGYTCQCITGYTGNHCESNIDECYNHTCLNDARCLDHINGYTCQCVDGFSGKNCETNINECDSDPCLNNGTCVDGTNDYTCQCISGFTGTNCEAIISPCTRSPCQNNGVCNIIDRKVTCKCPGDWFGDVCQYDNLFITSLWPQVGPIAGGTNITITGKDFPSPDADVTIGSIGNCITLNVSSKRIIVKTPPVNDVYAGTDNPIFVWFPSRKLNFSVDYIFKYKANPSVTSVHPLKTLNKGGSRLTVSGDHFDAVEMPLLKIDKTIQVIDMSENKSEIVNETITTYYGTCNKMGATELVCITPNLDLSRNIPVVSSGSNRKRREILSKKYWLQQDDPFKRMWNYIISYFSDNLPRDNRDIKVVHNRRKREIITKENLFIGVVLDGLDKFQNLFANNETKEYGKIDIINKPPSFQNEDKTQPFLFKPGSQLDIKGNHVNEIPKDDYKVAIGKGQCDIIDLTENILQCMPPQKEPPRDENTLPHQHRIEVHIGSNIKEEVGKLTYPSHSSLYLGLGFSVIVVMIIGAIILIVLKRRRASARQKQQQRSLVLARNNTESVFPLIHLPPVKNDFSEIMPTSKRSRRDFTRHQPYPEDRRDISALLGRRRRGSSRYGLMNRPIDLVRPGGDYLDMTYGINQQYRQHPPTYVNKLPRVQGRRHARRNSRSMHPGPVSRYDLESGSDDNRRQEIRRANHTHDRISPM